MVLLEVLERIKSGEYTDFDIHNYIDEKAGTDLNKLKLLQRHVEIFIIKNEQDLCVANPAEIFEKSLEEVFDSFLHKEKVKPALEQIVNGGLSNAHIKQFAASAPLQSRYLLLNPKNSNPNIWANLIITNYKNELLSESKEPTPEEAFEMLLVLAIDQCTERYGASFLFDFISVMLLRQAKKIIEKKIEAIVSGDDGKKGQQKSNNAKLPDADEWIVPIIKEIMSLEIPTHNEVLSIFEDAYPGFVLEFGRKRFIQLRLAKGMDINKTSIAKALKFIFEAKNPGVTITVRAITDRYTKLGHW